MKDLFKKYLHSLSTPANFDEFAEFVGKEENTNAIYDLMKPEWDESLQNNKDLMNPKPEILHRILNHISNQEITEARRNAKIYSLWLKIAAVLVVTLLMSSIWFYEQSQTEYAYLQEQTVRIPYGAKTKFSMPDGSIVWLNSGSTLTFSSDFSKKREVYLKGEAFFDVQKKKIPFSVNTDYGQVNVLGTAFNVQAFSQSEFAITLVRGSVQVNSNNQQSTLSPGEQARLVNNQLTKAEVGTELYTSWKDGKLMFKRESFPSLMERLERWFNVRIEYSPNDFNDLWYSGTIENETITEVMEMISMAAPVKFSFDSKTRVIKVNMK
jgi:transmembrane sensor